MSIIAFPRRREIKTSTRRTTPPRRPVKTWSIAVLLVEDDPADRALIEGVLKRHPDVGAVRGTDAPGPILFELACGGPRPNLILLDLSMPKLNGLKFLKALRGIPAMRDTPVVVLTASRSIKDIEAARAGGASFYLVKPDSYQELESRLCGVIQRATTGAWST